MSTASLPARSDGLGHIPIDQEAVLKAIGISPRDPNAQALLLTCERYGLDPVLRHMILIQGRPYVTRDGLLHVAHRSGQFDGIEVLEQGESPSHFTARVAVYRKDMTHPFTYIGRYPKAGGNKAYGPEMAVKTAECMALRRAFNVGLCAREEAWDQDLPDITPNPAPAPKPSPRAAINRTFPARQPQQRKDESWAGWIARRLQVENVEFRNHETLEGVEKPTDLCNQWRMANHLASRLVDEGILAIEVILGDDGKRDRTKTLEVVSRYFAENPEWVKDRAEEHLVELWGRGCAALGILNPKEVDHAEDGVIEASTEAGGREPGEEG